MQAAQQTAAALYMPQQLPNTLPSHIQRLMGVDYGKKRVGIAVGNTLTAKATPCPTIAAQGNAQIAAIVAQAAQWEVHALVLGVPYHPDGNAHANTRRAIALGQQLAQHAKLPVYTVDERYSTTEALAYDAHDADAIAACIILEQFLNRYCYG